MAARNSDSYGLMGERAFADSQGAIRFNQPIFYKQKDWRAPVRVHPWFRRFYFDGYSSGRFEIGLLIHDDVENAAVASGGSTYDASQLAEAVLAAPVTIRSLDGSETTTDIGSCGPALAMAYVLATTRNDALLEFPAAESVNSVVFIGPPTLQIRLGNALATPPSRDARILSDGAGGKLCLTSSKAAKVRNNIIVQCSPESSLGELPTERASRVIFAHLNALIFANSQIVRSSHLLVGLSKRRNLADAVKRSLKYFESFQPADPKASSDAEFARAIRKFGTDYAGRMDDLVDKLQELTEDLSKPSLVAKTTNVARALMELVLTTTIKATVEASLKAR